MTASSTRARKSGKPKAPFTPVPPLARLDLPALERAWQARWQDEGTMERYLNRNELAEQRYSFIDGPITANNQMGVHHAWNRALKDYYQRYHTMLGHRQRYQNGFDCQGLWVEVEVEKEFKFKSKRDIEDYGIAAFVERCKERVQRFADLITEQSKRLGYWMHWDDSYYTMSEENNYTIWHFLKTCNERGLIYKGRDAMPWCPRCATGISDMEINEGRKEVQHTSLYVRFPLKNREHEYLLVWTTTPWTLPANVAAAVNPDLTYAKVEQDGNTYYLSKDLVAKLAKLRGKQHGEYTVVGELSGAEMVGWEYSGPFDELQAWRDLSLDIDLKNTRPVSLRNPLVHRVVAWKEVAAAEGTGIVHIAPGCGREDFGLGKEEGLRVIAPIDEDGVYFAGYGAFTGQYVGEVARPVMDDLKAKGIFYQTETIQHVYPHCWRCGTELVFRNVEEWFINMGPKDDPNRNGLRYEIMDVVEQIRWLPDFGLERELDWLRNMEDWMISKKRYWGLALPIFQCDQCGHFEVMGSREELHERAVTGWDVFDGHTPHRPYVDAVKINCSTCGHLAERVKDVGNPWLDAGIVPYATLKYNTDRDYWREWFPADFITESFPGQFRNWFYSMLVMSTVLEDAPPFKTVLGFASVVDHQGNQMSKSKGTAIWFAEAVEVLGADTMRWLYATQPPEQDVWFPLTPEELRAAQGHAGPVRLNDKLHQIRSTLDTLWNVYSFFVTYANIDGFDPAQYDVPAAKRADVDRWLLAELQETVRLVTEGLDDFNSVQSANAISDFIEQVSNWYIRRVRRRFWKNAMDDDKAAAYLTLYEALVAITKLLAPFTPFLAEEIYTNLAGQLAETPDGAVRPSVHLTDWPKVDPALVNADLRTETRLVQRVVNLGRAAREKVGQRVRQPLGMLYVRVGEADQQRLARLADQALDELNIKALQFLPQHSEMLTASLKPRMAALGQKYRAKMQPILAAIKAVSGDDALTFATVGELTVTLPDGETVTLTPAEVEVAASAQAGYVAAEDHGLVVVLDASLTPELEAEGTVRDLTHMVNALRKKADFAIEDHIHTTIVTDAALATVIEQFADYVREETLSDTLTVLRPDDGPPALPDGAVTEDVPAAKLGNHATTVAITRAVKKPARAKAPKANGDGKGGK
ncbi:MAG: isoleucine--tRNA ligase [Ktedonobacterales bacterium]|nr:isoleucine--tRNA ligase [Ktedonobacterales bacterium]